MKRAVRISQATNHKRARLDTLQNKNARSIFRELTGTQNFILIPIKAVKSQTFRYPNLHHYSSIIIIVIISSSFSDQDFFESGLLYYSK